MLLQLTLLHTYCNVLNNTSTSVCVVDVHDIDTGMLLQLTLLHTYLKLNYVNMTTSCESYKTALQQQIRASFTTVNSQWQRMLCNNVNCNTIPVSISCTSTTQADVEVLFNTLQ
jgi:hypothetical protein